VLVGRCANNICVTLQPIMLRQGPEDRPDCPNHRAWPSTPPHNSNGPRLFQAQAFSKMYTEHGTDEAYMLQPAPSSADDILSL
jgi:hypothetical protein